MTWSSEKNPSLVERERTVSWRSYRFAEVDVVCFAAQEWPAIFWRRKQP